VFDDRAGFEIDFKTDRISNNKDKDLARPFKLDDNRWKIEEIAMCQHC
jgi:hypothetical protein